MENQERPEQAALLAFYSHTSRVFNSAVALTLASMAFYVSIFKSLIELPEYMKTPINLAIIIACILYFAVLYGVIRIVELNNQIQLLESIIQINEDTLHQFINDTIPRFRRMHRRFSQEELQLLRRGELPFLCKFNLAHLLAILIWTIIFVITATRL